MNQFSTVVAIIMEVIALIGVITPILARIHKLSEGTKCQLRSEMLRTYYHNREKRIIRQYEYENFVMLYDAYKALKGNSFIDKIYGEVIGFDVLT
jgi:hypothetical protein